jgi:signal transduction histidine kinase
MNLLVNAVGVSGAGDTVSVTVRRTNGRVRFTVQDEGPGV